MDRLAHAALDRTSFEDTISDEVARIVDSTIGDQIAGDRPTFATSTIDSLCGSYGAAEQFK